MVTVVSSTFLGIFSEHIMVNPHQLIGIHYIQELQTVYQISRSLIRLSYLKSSVPKINIAKLKALNHPIATINACHSSGAQNLSSDEMVGLGPVIYLAKGARVMLTMNIWTEVGLCNGALGTVLDFVIHMTRPPQHYQFVFSYSLTRIIIALLFLLDFRDVFQSVQ